jgi:hypothetical protein
MKTIKQEILIRFEEYDMTMLSEYHKQQLYEIFKKQIPASFSPQRYEREAKLIAEFLEL